MTAPLSMSPQNQGVTGASANADRATQQSPSPSVSALRVSIPSAGEFAHTIRSTLANNPNWLPEAMAAVAHGAQLALEALNQRRAASDAACLAALAMCDTKRFSPELRASLLGTI